MPLPFPKQCMDIPASAWTSTYQVAVFAADCCTLENQVNPQGMQHTKPHKAHAPNSSATAAMMLRLMTPVSPMRQNSSPTSGHGHATVLQVESMVFTVYIVTLLGGVACHAHRHHRRRPPKRRAFWPPASTAAAVQSLRAHRGPDLGLRLRACRAGFRSCAPLLELLGGPV